MNQEELDLFSIIERLISQWKIILIFNLISILILLFFLNPFNQVWETKIKFGINPSFKSDISFQTISALKNYAEIEATDIEEKYKSFLVNYDSYQNVVKDVFSYTPDETRSTYNNLYLENDRDKNQFLVFKSDINTNENKELLIKLNEFSNSKTQKWLISFLENIKLRFEMEISHKKEIQDLVIDQEILEAELNLESQIINYLSLSQMALNELKSAKTIALNLNYIEPEDKELYTIFNTKNLSIPMRFKIEQDLLLGENEAPISSSSYSLANISGVPLFLFGTKLIDSEIVKLENELNEIDDLFPALRENIKLLEKKKGITFIEGIEEDLLAVKSLELVISKLRVFIDNTNYKFISVDEKKVLTKSHYPNLFKGIIVLSLVLIISLIVALYNSERVIRHK